jgi:D-alanyl-D-alanine carboxypeptidase
VPSHRADTPASRRRATAPGAPPTRRSQRAAEARRGTTVTTPATRTAESRRTSPSTRTGEARRGTPVGTPSSRTAARRAARRSGPQLSAPQVGIAGALGLATIAAPISGAMAAPPPKAQANPIAAVAFAPAAPAFPAVNVQRTFGVEALRVVPVETRIVQTPSMLAARGPVLVTRASRSGERSVLPGCDGVARITGAPNGQLPDSVLCTLWESKHRLRADAAVAIAKLNIAYKQKFGDDICLTDSYRTLASQQRLAAIKPGLAAKAGTSNHGLGLAVDLCDGIEKLGSTRYEWMRDNAPAYGWDNPTWARPGGSGPQEAWHWEFVAGEGIGADYEYTD